MVKNRKKSNLQAKRETDYPGFGESLVEIFSMMKDKDLSKSNKNKKRCFKDEKGIFKEMDKGKKKGKTIVTE
jgi:hypothetical protein